MFSLLDMQVALLQATLHPERYGGLADSVVLDPDTSSLNLYPETFWHHQVCASRMHPCVWTCCVVYAYGAGQVGC